MGKREVLEAREMARDRETRDKEKGERVGWGKHRKTDGGKGGGDEEKERNSLNFFVAV